MSIDRFGQPVTDDLRRIGDRRIIPELNLPILSDLKLSILPEEIMARGESFDTVDQR